MLNNFLHFQIRGLSYTHCHKGSQDEAEKSGVCQMRTKQQVHIGVCSQGLSKDKDLHLSIVTC